MELDLNTVVLLSIVALGLLAGVLGGLLGIGGSIVMIPGLTWIIGRDQHLYQAAAMIANVVVAIPAARRHHRAGAINLSVIRLMLPAAIMAIAFGVWLSNRSWFMGHDGGIWLGRLMAVFLLYVIVVNLKRLQGASESDTVDHDKITMTRCGLTGASMGVVGGLLGVGGGTVSVPMQQLLIGLPLRVCIANSTAVICFTAIVGSLYKNATLSIHGYRITDSIMLACLLAPSCWIGGHLGAKLTHAMPLRQVRIAFIILMFVAAVKMAGILG